MSGTVTLAEMIRAYEARIIRLEAGLRRLASPEAFVTSRSATDEEIARMKFADEIVNDRQLTNPDRGE